MSTLSDDDGFLGNGVPELTPLGKRIELLRFERRLSKRVLAQRAGTSRQQLWRVMTGKSELTSSLCSRLAEVLETDSRSLRDAAASETLTEPRDVPSPRSVFVREQLRAIDPASSTDFCQTLEEYVASEAGLARTFETLPPTEDGRRLKRVLLDAIEDIAMSRSLKLPRAIFDLRRTIVNDEELESESNFSIRAQR